MSGEEEFLASSKLVTRWRLHLAEVGGGLKSDHYSGDMLMGINADGTLSDGKPSPESSAHSPHNGGCFLGRLSMLFFP